MKKSLKAVLVSALIYPGLGHFIFKKYVVGIAFIISFSIPLLLLIQGMLAKANQVVLQIQQGETALDVTAISNSLMTSSDMQTLDTYTYIMLAIWIISVLDVYRVSRKAKG